MRPKNDDYNSRLTADVFPKNYYGSHSLKAWFAQLHKGDFGGTTDWSGGHKMQDYCERDVEVTLALLQAMDRSFPPTQ